jgi:hypothetical protein
VLVETPPEIEVRYGIERLKLGLGGEPTLEDGARSGDEAARDGALDVAKERAGEGDRLLMEPMP